MKGFIRSAAFGCVSALAILSATPAAAQGQPAPLLFDDFLFDNAGQPAENYNGFFQWEVTGGSVDLVGGNLPGAPLGPPTNPFGRFVDLGGSTGDPGLFRARLATPVVPLSSYTLNFDYRSTGGDLNSATVFVGDQSFTVSTAAGSFIPFSRTFTFAPGTTSAFVAFQGFEGDTDNSGIGIDRIQFGPTLIAAVPEPSTWAVMMFGFGALGAALRRDRRSRRALA